MLSTRSLSYLTLCSLLIVSLLVGEVSAAKKAGPGDPLKYPALSQNGLPLVFSENFETGNFERWSPTDATAWQILKQGENHVMNLNKKRSKFEPPVRSPYNRNLVKEVTVSDFVLDVKLQSTHEDYGHRDLCLFFGYQDDAHLYYVHLGKKMDPHANNIFIVNNAARKSISLTTTPGTNWDDNWHHARIVRNVESGSIEIYFDDMKKPAMTAKDKTFTWGQVGVGSFDDTGSFDNILLFGNPAK